MSYDRLRSSLADGLECRDLVALPDGSVDRYYTVTDARRDPVDTLDAFLDLLAGGGVGSLRLVPDGVRAGGEAVNTATQIHALDQVPKLYGHLDDPELGPFSFPTVSMGSPATVHVLTFDREEIMFSVESPDIRSWTLADLVAATAVDPDEWLDEAVVVMQNWVGFPGMTDALRDLATLAVGEATVVFDPGDVTSAPADAIDSLCAALATLADATTVVLTANGAEIERLVEVLGIKPDDTLPEVRLRDALGIMGVVRHETARAVAATGTITTVENFDADRVARQTGAGDRFDGGLAVGLAADLPWDETLALGNVCATYYVQHDRTATTKALLEFLESRPTNG
jgi:sugar/nucleoside kinase (ribokinase family)